MLASISNGGAVLSQYTGFASELPAMMEITLIGQRGIFGPVFRLFQGESTTAPSGWIILAVPLAIAVLWVLLRRQMSNLR